MKLTIITSILFATFFFNALSQNIEWVYQEKVTEFNNWAKKGITDNEGNVYIIAEYRSTSNVAGSPRGSYLQKISPSGEKIWEKIFLKTIAEDLDLDKDENIIVVGRYGGSWADTAYFDGIKSDYELGGFIIRYDKNGGLIYKKEYEWLSILSLKHNKKNGFYISGVYYRFSGTPENYYLDGHLIYNPNSSRSVLFVGKFNDNNNGLWVRQTSDGGISTSWGFNMKMDEEENIYVGSGFYNTLYFHNGNFVFSELGEKPFIVKYDQNGNFISAFKIGTSGQTVLNSFCVDSKGFIYAVGWNDSPLKLDDYELEPGYYFAKFNSNGDCFWARHSYYRNINCHNDTLYGTGETGGYNEHTDLQLKNGAFVMFTTTSGKDLLAWQPVGYVNMLAHNDGLGNIYLAGTFSGDVSFDNHSVSGYNTLFLAKLGNTSTGIKATEAKSEGFMVYPNPTKTQIHIKYNPLLSNENMQLKVFNSTGILVHNQSFTEDIKSIDISSFSSGVYFINLINGTEILSRKFVVNR